MVRITVRGFARVLTVFARTHSTIIGRMGESTLPGMALSLDLAVKYALQFVLAMLTISAFFGTFGYT